MREADDVPTEPLAGVERPLRVVRLARLMQRRVRAFGPAQGSVKVPECLVHGLVMPSSGRTRVAWRAFRRSAAAMLR